MIKEWRNLPIDIVNKILEYDGRIKYRNGEFVNIIHPTILKYYNYLLDTLIEKKRKIFKKSLSIKRYKHYFYPREDNSQIIKENIENFYFEFDFTSLPGVGLSYDYYWNHNYFKISYFDDRVYLNKHTREKIINIIE